MSTPIYDELCQMMPGPSGSSEESEAVAASGDEVAGATGANGQVSGGTTGNGQLGHHVNSTAHGPAEGADSRVGSDGAAE